MLLVGHLPIDPVTGAETPAAGQVQVSVEDAIVVLGFSAVGAADRRESRESRGRIWLRRGDLRASSRLSVLGTETEEGPSASVRCRASNSSSGCGSG